MIDYYLQTTDEAAMNVALECVAYTACAVDVIGIWYERTGGTDEEPEMTALPGWHFNVRSEEPIEWPETVTQKTPATPLRVWA